MIAAKSTISVSAHDFFSRIDLVRYNSSAMSPAPGSMPSVRRVLSKVVGHASDALLQHIGIGRVRRLCLYRGDVLRVRLTAAARSTGRDDRQRVAHPPGGFSNT